MKEGVLHQEKAIFFFITNFPVNIKQQSILTKTWSL